MEDAERASRRWLHRPLHRDWAVWVGLAVGLGYWLYAFDREGGFGDVSWSTALLNLPLHLLAGLAAFSVLVGCVRQFRLGVSEGHHHRSPG